ncbi:MAG: dihydroneopterin aldolase [Prevotella sp.]|nr:dihydroneopterin aldolase [Prevotella sp.]
MRIKTCNVHDTVVFIKNMRFHARHGVLEQESSVGGEFLVTVEVKADIQKAFHSDRVEDTINYATIYEIVKTEMNTPSALLEHVAARMAEAILQEFESALDVMVEIMKTNPPMGAQCEGAGVRASFTRS